MHMVVRCDRASISKVRLIARAPIAEEDPDAVEEIMAALNEHGFAADGTGSSRAGPMTMTRCGVTRGTAVVETDQIRLGLIPAKHSLVKNLNWRSMWPCQYWSPPAISLSQVRGT